MQSRRLQDPGGAVGICVKLIVDVHSLILIEGRDINQAKEVSRDPASRRSWQTRLP